MDNFGIFLALITVVVIAAAFFILCRYADTLLRGSVLVVGLLLWLTGGGGSIGNTQDRLATWLGGLITMVGFITTVFGIIQVRRKR